MEVEIPEYRFLCFCGCSTVSEPVGREYVRLVGKKWSAKGHEADHQIVKEYKGGFIIKWEEF